ncbi:hypothetical protein DHEL01_v211986 [Diaporthe helianthi]|uniref:Dynamin N-terminal domain-containing protein n=1 Tax=Diaporthe helianthi TaxID=158607 RepID=A0A2P5HH99_DIAHE|nr:hypothetical protein DHEL01_v211986 [Diaporthe helianthi]
MASEEPPSILHPPLDTSTRLVSAPPTVDKAAKTTVVDMDTAVNGVKAPQAAAQNAGSDHGVTGNQPATTGQDEKQTSETATPSKVKVESDSVASVPQNVPSVSPDETSAQQGNSSGKEEDATAATSNPETQQKPDIITLDNIQKLVDETDPSKLDAGVGAALAVLDTLQAPLSDSKQITQQEWLATINKLKQQSNKTRTVVAVVGETGAGKSSLINALLGEDKLLVTSGWRACTAVICEISYNDMDDPQKAYRAEIEFVSQESWDHELRLLLESELIENNKLSSDKSDSKTEAGCAYEKIKAVYPDLTDDMIVHHTAKSLAERANVVEVLGTTRRVECRSASDLCSAVQKYVDSKEKSTKMGPRKAKDMAFWPLIKAVRIFCRAEALSTGLVVVDLPGVADSNAARSAVASKYMAECTAVWVVAPIKRATDNKAAKELMGKSSRLQMKLDGIYANVTFICTMTDAIEFAEAIDSFDDDGQIRAKNAREDEVQNTIEGKRDALKRVQTRIHESDQGINEISRELKIWRALLKKHQKGHTVYPPYLSSKRKRPARPQKARSRRQVIDEDSDDEEEVEQPPLTENDISTEVEKLDNRHTAAVDVIEEMEGQAEALINELTNLEQEKKDAAVDAARMCVQRRNEVVKKAIGVDFAAGIKDLDIAEAQDDENFDPSVEIRDYDVVARSLPVFTISAKAYQQISRPKKRETEVAGFRTLLDTEIPQLVEHALKLPEKGHIEAQRRFLNEVRQLLGSLTIWCTVGDDQLGYSQMSAEEQSWEMRYLKIAMENLQKDLDLVIVTQQKELENIVSAEIEFKSNTATKHASKTIEGIVAKWPVKKDAGGKGIHPMTYRSVCRHGGAKTKGPTSFDFVRLKWVYKQSE